MMATDKRPWRMPDAEVGDEVTVHPAIDDPFEGVAIGRNGHWLRIETDDGKTVWFDERAVCPTRYDGCRS